jgi:protein-tyrosine phosphatase
VTAATSKTSPTRVRLSFVCLGNICRSPTAEAVMRHLVKQAGLQDQVFIDSAGTGDWHIGEGRDPRSCEVGRRRGIPLTGAARQFRPPDFERFDYVLAMDRQNLQALKRLAPDAAARDKIHLLRSFDLANDGSADEVPDPYFGGPSGFDRVFDICLAACQGLLAHLRREHGLG